VKYNAVTLATTCCLSVLQLVSKVFKKVHSKYADVTEQRVETLVQQLLQENR